MQDLHLFLPNWHFITNKAKYISFKLQLKIMWKKGEIFIGIVVAVVDVQKRSYTVLWHCPVMKCLRQDFCNFITHNINVFFCYSEDSGMCCLMYWEIIHRKTHMYT